MSWCLALALCTAAGCKAKVPTITQPFSDDFQRADLGPNWRNTGAEYRIADGKLKIAGAYNHPLWLRQKLPRDVVVDVDVRSDSPSGDIKLELFGDGESFDPDKGRYDPTGYVFALGGWNNTDSIIGRLGEHDDAVKAVKQWQEGSPRPVQVGKVYHWTITRKGNLIDWKIDGQPFLSWSDPQPLEGDTHAYLGINNWESEISYDNLRITPAR